MGILYMILGLIVISVVIRFFFRLMGANPSNGFVSFIYTITAPLVAPFAGIFGQSINVDPTIVNGVFEWASLVAIIVYGLIAAVVSRATSVTHHRV